MAHGVSTLKVPRRARDLPEGIMPNRLAGETSPYLLQHQNNPVDWYPWAPEALERARREDKPIFLSIGYSACHWCHVMEHESFEDPGIAELLNRDFVCIKVDREERPDLDHIYMNAVQLMTGRGGWPMSMFLTPDLQPFYGGTYWPPRAGRGMPGFDQVLTAVVDAWKHRRNEAIGQAAELTSTLHQIAAEQSAEGDLEPALLDNAATALERSFDRVHGGFGGAPKFPHSMDLQVLLRVWRRKSREGLLDVVKVTLDRMAAGGIYDHLGGGFARYSVDERWLVPHFEKMLYDNALLAACYLEAYQATGYEKYAQVVRETLDYLGRDMTDPSGGIYSTEDADSEGEEGKFYVWTPDQVHELLGVEKTKTFCYVYDVTEEGNFEGQNILNLPKTIEQSAAMLGRDPKQLADELVESRRLLFEARAKRERPGRDDKVLVSWNALAIDALARAAGVLGAPRYLDAAVRCASFILREMRRGDGKLLHTWRGGVAKLDAYLDDYAGMVNALVSLYEATFEEPWIDEAIGLAGILLNEFADPEQGGFFYTARGHETLITRPKEWYDSSTPSGNALAATGLLRLAKLTGRDDFQKAAERTLRGGTAVMRGSPTAGGQMLLALDFWLGPTPEIVIVGDPATADTSRVLSDLCRRFIPNKVVACRARPETGSAALAPLFAGKTAAAVTPTVYICENFACREPLAGGQAALATWKQLAAIGGTP
jgi:uncharacterized protein YyaL (SSP411 family)